MVTEQEAFWAGEFGHDYSIRNRLEASEVAANTFLFSNAFNELPRFSRILELGANVGLNVASLQHLYPAAQIEAVEINENAASELRKLLPKEFVHQMPLLEFTSSASFDIVIVKGVLIHQNPNSLGAIYQRLSDLTANYLFIAEYYSPQPVEVEYRGHREKLFKRDFAGEFMQSFPEFGILKSGFAYHSDSPYGHDDVTWFVMARHPGPVHLHQ
jgi:spore coat polysaccharide biosynthesis protein SpsF